MRDMLRWGARATVAATLVVGGMIAGPATSRAAVGDPAKPPMGWNSWNSYGCGINESLIRQMADSIVSSGMKDAGYEYVVIDECWYDPNRDANGNLRGHPVYFPSGIAALADYVHGKGLKFGIYMAPGEKTCAQFSGDFPGATGSKGHERKDAQQFAAWGVDYVKYDWCSDKGTLEEQIAAFTLMRDELKATGRPMVYSINPNSYHPAKYGASHDWGGIADLWRTTEDISAAWDTGKQNSYPMGVVNIIDVNGRLGAQAGPGRWNDPDMLEVGVGTMTETENRAHFSMWAMMAAPLMAGNDVRSQSATTRSILTAPEVIAVDQDPLGRQGVKVADTGGRQVWSKVLSGTGTRAVALFNRTGATTDITANLSTLGLGTGGATVRDLWARTDLGSFTGSITRSVPAHGVVLLKVTGTEAAPLVSTVKTDSRAVNDLRITADFTIDGIQHQDVELVGALTGRSRLALDAWGGLPGGNGYRGNFLYSRGPGSGSAGFDIQKLDTRSIQNLKLSLSFTINGEAHFDDETVDTSAGSVNLQLNAWGGTWDGTRWVGNFLRPAG